MNENEPVLTVDKVIGIIIALAAFFAVLALIWAQWRVFQWCLTVDLFGVLAVILIPEDK